MTKNEILDEAKRIINGERENQYGEAENNFARIGLFWTAYLGQVISAEDVALMMCLFKIARAKTGTGTDDTFVDLAGYAALGGEIAGQGREVSECVA